MVKDISNNTFHCKILYLKNINNIFFVVRIITVTHVFTCTSTWHSLRPSNLVWAEYTWRQSMKSSKTCHLVNISSLNKDFPTSKDCYQVLLHLRQLFFLTEKCRWLIVILKRSEVYMCGKHWCGTWINLFYCSFVWIVFLYRYSPKIVLRL